jgi:hypothetical protein
MRKFLIVVTLLLAIFVAVFRQRIFLRDPLGKVERNGIVQDGMRVYINYSNDILVEAATENRRYLVQGWSKVPGVPKHLACLTGVACLTDADQAEVLPLGNSTTQTHAAMSAIEITFEDETGATVKVQLR